MVKIYNVNQPNKAINHLIKLIDHGDQNALVILPCVKSVQIFRSIYKNSNIDVICYSQVTSKLNLFSKYCTNLETRLLKVIDNLSLELCLMKLADSIKHSLNYKILIHDLEIHLKNFILKYYTYNLTHTPLDSEYEIFDTIITSFENMMTKMELLTLPQCRNIAVERLERSWNENCNHVIYAVAPNDYTPYSQRILKILTRLKSSKIIISSFPTCNSFKNTSLQFIDDINFNKKHVIDLNQLSYKPNYQLIETHNILNEAKAIITLLKSNTDKTIGIITQNRRLIQIINDNLEIENLYFNKINSSYLQFKEVIFLLQVIKAVTHKFNFIHIIDILESELLELDDDIIEQCKVKLFDHNIDDLNNLTQILNQFDEVTLIITALKDLNISINNSKTFSQFVDDYVNMIMSLPSSKLESFHKSKGIKYCIEAAESIYESIKTTKISGLTFERLIFKVFNQKKYFKDTTNAMNINILNITQAIPYEFDILIIPSLNEEYYPKIINSWPLNDIKLCAALGLPSFNDQLYQDSYQFEKIIHNRNIIFTRSLYESSNESTESRWLSKLKHKFNIKNVFENSAYHKSHINYRSTCPVPPSSVRPKEFTVSQIEKLILNPYIYYVENVLNLIPMNSNNSSIQTHFRKDFGYNLHKTLSEVTYCNDIHKYKEQMIMIFTQHCLKQNLCDVIQNSWLKRVVRIAMWMHDYEQKIIDNITLSKINQKLSYNLDIDDHVISINTSIDRIIHFKDGSIKIIDYKSGYVPTIAQINSGKHLLIPITSLAFNHDCDIASEYIQMRGFKNIAQARKINVDNKAIKAQLRKLLNDHLNCGYRINLSDESLNHPKNYAHIQRVEEELAI